MIGQVIKLPDLRGMTATLPKELQPEKLEKILLTPQCFQLLEEFAQAVNLGQANVSNADPQSGMILSGPNGVGKTVESYLITCAAYVNNCLLIYIVRFPFLLCLPFFFFCSFPYLTGDTSHWQASGRQK